MQSGQTDGKRYRSSMHGLATIIKEEGGLKGVYRGIGPKLTQSVLTAAILFMSKVRQSLASGRVELNLRYRKSCITPQRGHSTEDLLSVLDLKEGMFVIKSCYFCIVRRPNSTTGSYVMTWGLFQRRLFTEVHSPEAVQELTC